MAIKRIQHLLPQPILHVMLACGMLLLCGCIKIKTTVQMNEDGSGKVIEEVVFSEKLVNVSRRVKDAPTIDDLTGEAAIKRRLAQMGKGVSLLDRKVVKQPDGSIQLTVRYGYEDISALRLAPVPYGLGWEDVQLAFKLTAQPTLAAGYNLDIRMMNSARSKPAVADSSPLGELEAQQIRQLLPIFKDMLQGFELKLRLEIYEPKKWATVTRGHLSNSHLNPLSGAGGQLTIYHLTDKHLLASEEGLMLVVPWRQVGRENDLWRQRYPPGMRLLPHVNFMENGVFDFHWRTLQTPRGREYY